MKRIFLYMTLNLIIFIGCDVEIFKTIKKPTTPVLISPINNAKDMKLDAELNWSVSKDLYGGDVKYNVYFGTVNPPTSIAKSLHIGTTITFYGLLSNTTYYWKIEAIDGKGGTSVSDVRYFKTLLIQPSLPELISPLNNATNVNLTPTLTWTASTSSIGESIKYNIYFGNVYPPITKVSSLQTLTSYTPTLSANTTYYWKIEADDENGGVAMSEVWNFKTILPPSTPILTSPNNNATNVSLTPTLTWIASNSSNGGTIKYNVYFGTADLSLPKVSSLQTGTTYTLSLSENTTYYWKIGAVDEYGVEAISEIINFKTIVLPSTPVLISPSNNTTNASLTPTLTWSVSNSSSGGTIKYNVYFGTSDLSMAKVSSLQTRNTFTLSLFENTTYYWKIEADDGNGGVSMSEVSSFKTLIPPSVPVLTNPSNNATNVILTPTLTWTASTNSSGGSIKYNVYFGTVYPPTSRVSSLQTGTTFMLSLSTNTIYYWKIEADDGNGGIAVSEVRNFKTLIPPSVPILTNPSNNATNVSLTSNLTWTASTSLSGGSIKYNVYLGTINPPTSKLSSLQTSTTFTPALSANTNYYWKIEAVDENGGVAVSEVKNFKTELIPPSVPVLNNPINNATNVSLTSNLTWTASTSSSGRSIKYNVYLGTDYPPITKVSNIQGGTTYTPTTLFSNTRYYWKIEADDGNGGTSFSEVRNFKTELIPPSVPVLNNPSNNAINISLTSNLTWTASTSLSGGGIKYNVYFGTINPPILKVSNLQTSTTFTPTLSSNTFYFWKIEADDGNGGASLSEVRNFKTALIPPSLPELISPRNNAINICLTDILIWEASTSSSIGSIKYNIYFGTVNPPTSIVSNLQTGTRYTPNLSTNTTYYWKIEADDGNGGISVSEVRNFKTITTSSTDFISDGFSFVCVEGGTFTMGCTVEQGSDCDDTEKPSHSVTLTSFSIGKYEVTQAQWSSVMGTNPSSYQNCNDCPIDSLSWDDFQTFLTTLNKKTGKNYRLPTEAEWEYAARGGKNSKGYKYSGSNDVGSVAWYGSNSSNITHNIGTKNANELGIYDMSGNIWEFCSDWYGSYSSSSETNPTGPSIGIYKVIRGGGINSSDMSVQVSRRYHSGPNYFYRDYNDGFRLVLP